VWLCREQPFEVTAYAQRAGLATAAPRCHCRHPRGIIPDSLRKPAIEPIFKQQGTQVPSGQGRIIMAPASSTRKAIIPTVVALACGGAGLSTSAAFAQGADRSAIEEVVVTAR